ncbi:MAG: hypothetical protein WBA46_19450 [Thermomicrobiales bacterium]
MAIPAMASGQATPEAKAIHDGLTDLDAESLGYLGIAEAAHVTASGTIKGGLSWISAYGLLLGKEVDMAAPTFMRAISSRVIRDSPLGATISDWAWSNGKPIGGTDDSAMGWITVGTGGTAITYLMVTLRIDSRMQVIYGPVPGAVGTIPDVSALQAIQVSSLPRWGESAESLLPTKDDLPYAEFTEVESSSYPFGG